MKKLQTKKSIACDAKLYLAIWCFCLTNAHRKQKARTLEIRARFIQKIKKLHY